MTIITYLQKTCTKYIKDIKQMIEFFEIMTILLIIVYLVNKFMYQL